MEYVFIAIILVYAFYKVEKLEKNLERCKYNEDAMADQHRHLEDDLWDLEDRVDKLEEKKDEVEMSKIETEVLADIVNSDDSAEVKVKKILEGMR